MSSIFNDTLSQTLSWRAVLLQSLGSQFGTLLTSHWGGPSCLNFLVGAGAPPAGRTATTHSIHSDRPDREDQGHRESQECREDPSLRHDRLCRKLLGPGHLQKTRKVSSGLDYRKKMTVDHIFFLCKSFIKCI